MADKVGTNYSAGVVNLQTLVNEKIGDGSLDHAEIATIRSELLNMKQEDQVAAREWLKKAGPNGEKILNAIDSYELLDVHVKLTITKVDRQNLDGVDLSKHFKAGVVVEDNVIAAYSRMDGKAMTGLTIVCQMKNHSTAQIKKELDALDPPLNLSAENPIKIQYWQNQSDGTRVAMEVTITSNEQLAKFLTAAMGSQIIQRDSGIDVNKGWHGKDYKDAENIVALRKDGDTWGLSVGISISFGSDVGGKTAPLGTGVIPIGTDPGGDGTGTTGTITDGLSGLIPIGKDDKDERGRGVIRKKDKIIIPDGDDDKHNEIIINGKRYKGDSTELSGRMTAVDFEGSDNVIIAMRELHNVDNPKEKIYAVYDVRDYSIVTNDYFTNRESALADFALMKRKNELK
jgi:hypothetical protein